MIDHVNYSCLFLPSHMRQILLSRQRFLLHMIPAPFENRVVRVFHGTSIEKAMKIVEDQWIIPSENVFDWLGHGVYFWEESYQRARQWAERKYLSKAAVVSTDVKLGHCMNLFDSSWSTVIKRAYEDLHQKHQLDKIPLPVNRAGRRELDCAVVNAIAENIYDIDTVRAAYIEGEPAFPTSLFVGLAHIQMVARNPDIIVGRYEIEEGS